MTRYRILPAADLHALEGLARQTHQLPDDWRPAVLYPWLQALALNAHQFQVRPHVREFSPADGVHMLIVDVAATRWVPGRAPEIAFLAAGPKGPLTTIDGIGRKRFVYAWEAPPVEVPPGLEPLAAWAEADTFPTRVAGDPVAGVAV